MGKVVISSLKANLVVLGRHSDFSISGLSDSRVCPHEVESDRPCATVERHFCQRAPGWLNANRRLQTLAFHSCAAQAERTSLKEFHRFVIMTPLKS